MRRTVSLLLLLLVALSLPVGAQERVTVFRDLAWDDSSKVLGLAAPTRPTGHFHSEDAHTAATILRVALIGLYPEDVYSDIKFDTLVRYREDLTLGSLPLKYIVYGFINDKLSVITLTSDKKSHFRQVLHARYGQPSEETPHFDTWLLPDDTVVSFQIETGQLFLYSPRWIETREMLDRRHRELIEKDATSW